MIDSDISFENNATCCKPTNQLTIKAVTQPVFHGEGPHWDQNTGVLYYSDTFNATVIKWDSESNQVTRQKIGGRDSIAVAIPIKGKKNELVVAADRFLYKLYWDGKGNNTGKLTQLRMFEESKCNNQFNDGKCDDKGNFWLGSLTRNKDLSVQNGGGSVYRVTSDLKKEIKITNTDISNGIAWTKDNEYFLWIDSKPKLVTRYDFDLNSGAIDNPKVIYKLPANIPGIPDGMTIDKDDTLWIALFGGGGVLNIEAKTGKFIRLIKLPVSLVTSATWGGPSLDTLYVTTSQKSLNETQRLKEPLAGAVFEIKGLGTKGLPANDFVLKI